MAFRRFLVRGRFRRTPSLLQGYLFVSSAVLVASVVLYTLSLIHRLEKQSELVSEVFARFFATATFPATGDPEIVALFEEVMKGINFPMVITDHRGVPLAWRGIGIDPDAVPYDVYRDADPENPAPGPMRDILAKAHEFDEMHDPIPMHRPGDPRVLAMFHYGESDLVPELRWIPLVQLATVMVLVFLGYLGYRSIKVGEQRSIWVGMAKETAHQLGTPISSLMGWVDLMKAKCDPSLTAEDPPEGERRVTRPPGFVASADLATILTEMERDVQRTAQVASRFETIGSVPRLHPDDPSRMAHETVEYFRLRWARLGTQIEIEEEYARTPAVYLNRDLLQWVFENLLRNAMDALPRSGGHIRIASSYRHDRGVVEIRFSDDGRGMTPRELQRAFEPGFTTKARGWGLGLALARRIVEEYHGGRIWARSDGPGHGTTFIMTFPV